VTRRFRTVDAHAGGGPLRLVVEGHPAPQGATMLEKRAWARAKADGVRRVLLLEPRGHGDLCGALLTDPVSDGADTGVLFMDTAGYGTMSGHGIIAVTTIAIERGLVSAARPNQIVFDTPAGIVRATGHLRRAVRGAGPASGASPRVERVSWIGVPSFVLAPGVSVRAGLRDLRVDVAFGGAFYAIVDIEAAGLALSPARLPELRKVGWEIARAVEKTVKVQHPVQAELAGIAGTVFTGPSPSGHADLAGVTVVAGAHVGRSPSGTGTCALMAVLDAMGLLQPGQAFVHEGPIGTMLSGTTAGRTRVGEFDAILPEIEGSAWITGDHTFVVDDEDPLKRGFRL